MVPVPISNISVFGDPGVTTNFVKLPFPFPMRMSYDLSQTAYNFYGHRYIAHEVIGAFKDILHYFGLEFIKEHNLDIYGGCYANRQTVSGKRKSVHAWGLAIDYLPDLGPYGKPSLIPYTIVDIFKNRGFVWGGDWDGKYSDGMHFSAVIE